MILVLGSWALKPSRIESSVEIASITPLLQPDQAVDRLRRADGLGGAGWRCMTSIGVDSALAQTRLPASAPMPASDELGRHQHALLRVVVDGREVDLLACARR